MGLSKLPKAFVFEESKRYFPYLFNTSENQEEEREKFLIWHIELTSEGYIFNFKNEIWKYCKYDVTIMRLACLAFLWIFLECSGICPFTETCTVAGAACAREIRLPLGFFVDRYRED